MNRREHPFVAWLIEHFMLVYIAIVVSAILPLVVLELFR